MKGKINEKIHGPLSVLNDSDDLLLEGRSIAPVLDVRRQQLKLTKSVHRDVVPSPKPLFQMLNLKSLHADKIICDFQPMAPSNSFFSAHEAEWTGYAFQWLGQEVAVFFQTLLILLPPVIIFHKDISQLRSRDIFDATGCE